MRKRNLVRTMVIVFCAVAVVGSVVLAGEAKTPQEVYKDTFVDEMVMNSTVFEKHTKSPVTFSHAKHGADYKIACDQCHHIMKDGENTWAMGAEVAKCGTCHDQPGKAPKDAEDAVKITYLKEAFHANCVTCHKATKAAMKEEGKKTVAPTVCTKCHIKPAE